MKIMNFPGIMRILFLLVFVAVFLPAQPVAAAGETLTLSVNQGSVGRTVTVNGSGYTVPDGQSRGVVLMFGKTLTAIGQSVSYTTNIYKEIDIVPLSSSGVFSKTFQVPAALDSGQTAENVAAGTYYIYVTYYYLGQPDPKGLTVLQVAPFSVVVSTLTLSPNNGNVGAPITLSGTYFGASETVIVKYDGVQMAVSGTSVTDANGSLTGASITAPPSTAGAHTVTVTGQTSGVIAQSSFTVKPALTLNQASGPSGTVVTVSGNGFGNQQSVALVFGDVGLSAAATDATGAFTASFPVPAKASGSYMVKATDTGSNTSGALFEITPSGVTINPTNGNPGAQVTVNGTGFAHSRPISISFNNANVAAANSDAEGKFSATFAVPEVAGGTYKVKATDGFNTNEVNFTVLLDIDISPATSSANPAHIGQEINLTGSGGIPGTAVIVTYNGAQVATTTVEEDRDFDVSFAIPKSSAGQQLISITVGASTTQFPLFIESVLPPLPAPLKPEAEAKAKEKAVFDWASVTDDSAVTYTLQIATNESFSASTIVLEKSGLTDSEYTLTESEALEKTEKGASYFWRVRSVDGAGNKSPWTAPSSFLIGGFSFAMSQTVIYVLFGVGALGLGVLGFWLGRKTSYY